MPRKIPVTVDTLNEALKNLPTGNNGDGRINLEVRLDLYWAVLYKYIIEATQGETVTIQQARLAMFSSGNNLFFIVFFISQLIDKEYTSFFETLDVKSNEDILTALMNSGGLDIFGVFGAVTVKFAGIPKVLNVNKQSETFDGYSYGTGNDDFVDKSAFIPAFMYSLNLDGDNEYESFYEMLASIGYKDFVIKYHFYISDEEYAYLSQGGNANNLDRQFLGNLFCVCYKLRGYNGYTAEYEVTYSDTALDSNSFYKKKPNLRSIITINGNNDYLKVSYVWDGILSDNGGELEINYKTGDVSLSSETNGRISDSVYKANVSIDAVLSYLYQTKISVVIDPSRNVGLTQNNVNSLFEVKYNNVYVDIKSETGIITIAPLTTSSFSYNSSNCSLYMKNQARRNIYDGYYHEQTLLIVDEQLTSSYYMRCKVNQTVLGNNGSSGSYLRENYKNHLLTENVFAYFDNKDNLPNFKNIINTYSLSFKKISYMGSYDTYIISNTSANLTDGINALITYFSSNSEVPSEKQINSDFQTINFSSASGAGIQNQGTLNENISFYEQSVCIALDTPITMADGTKKLACEVKEGDYILTKSGADKVVWIDSYMKKSQPYHIVYTFSDGRILKIANDHRVYSLDDKKYKKLSQWKIGEKTLTETGEIISLVKSRVIEKPLEHCIVYTLKDNSQYANGILTGNRLANIKWKWLRRRGAKWYWKHKLIKETKNYNLWCQKYLTK